MVGLVQSSFAKSALIRLFCNFITFVLTPITLYNIQWFNQLFKKD
jgi:hypothetical protein